VNFCNFDRSIIEQELIYGSNSNYRKQGQTIRSDCFVTLEMKDGGGIDLQLESKVAVMYGESVKSLAFQILDFLRSTMQTED